MDLQSSLHNLLSTKLDGSNFSLWEFHFGIFVQGLRPFNLTFEKWTHLRTIHEQSNLAREFELECNITKYTQGDKNVRSFYAGLQLLLSEQDQIPGQNISKAGLKEVLEERNKTRVVQFLIRLCPEFEPICGSLLNREVRPALDVVLATVLCEETILETQAAMESTPLPSVASLKKNICAYCKIIGHHISDCRRHPNHSRNAHQAYQTNVTTSSGSFPSGHDLEKLIRDSIEAALP
ncbi:hypothetical protein T459_11472 [Capsicum annuum]|uniref:Retrotransposon gag domain-containing protein n=1 Tax=Capsicum annuum TaxID=4072 RepID=A0A2G2ZM11_CAPAN|nr:hypothetical protein T459_11472 [Capsicum annuum]